MAEKPANHPSQHNQAPAPKSTKPGDTATAAPAAAPAAPAAAPAAAAAAAAPSAGRRNRSRVAPEDETPRQALLRLAGQRTGRIVNDLRLISVLASRGEIVDVPGVGKVRQPIEQKVYDAVFAPIVAGLRQAEECWRTGKAPNSVGFQLDVD